MNKLLQMLRDNARSERKPLNLVRNESTGDATLYVYDVIDAYWGINSLEVAQMIAGLDPNATLSVRFNTPGGDVFEGRAIAQAIRMFKGKTLGYVDALCASAGTTIALACDQIEIADGAFFMIHNGWTYGYGDKNDLAKTVDLLQKIDGAIAADYVTRTGKTSDEVVAWMDAETWFSAQEAVDVGFCNRLMVAPEKTGDSTANRADARTWNLSAFTHAPKALTEPPPEPAPNVDAQLAAALANRRRRLQLLALA